MPRRFFPLYLVACLALASVATPTAAPVVPVVPAQPPAPISADDDLIARFDTLVAGPLPGSLALGEAGNRPKRAVPDMVIDGRLNADVEFPRGATGAMYIGQFDGSPAIFTRSGTYLDASVMTAGDIRVRSFDGVARDVAGPAPAEWSPARTQRRARSVPPGHREDPAAYNLRFTFFKHDDLADTSLREIHSRYVAWWVGDLSARVLPTYPMRVSYADRVPWLTDMMYGQDSSLHDLDRVLKTINDFYGLAFEKTFKRKYILLTAERPMAGTTGVAFQGGNEAIASVLGRSRIVAHELGHMLGATHDAAEAQGWFGCETNMVAKASAVRDDCMRYSKANERAIRSYMRHGPHPEKLREMADLNDGQ